MVNVVDEGIGDVVVDIILDGRVIDDVETSTEETIVLEVDSDCG